jgi:toxin HigB-1
MIKSFRHKGLERYYLSGDAKGLRADQLSRVRRILAILDSAMNLETLELLPGMRLHPRKGDMAGFWSVAVSGNWRIVFRIENGDIFDVEIIDYH